MDLHLHRPSRGKGLHSRRSTAKPRDVYGLALSTIPEAAEAYNLGLGRVLRVHAGADVAFRAAVDADPGFALGHAALALLGHEFGAAVNVDAALFAAELAVRQRGTERERSQVAAVAERVRRGTAGSPALTRHIADHPRDALMVSVAVPTIAFAGVYELPEDTWSLVEGLAPAYGDDWWYAGLLAFIRQEQERWVDAAELADRALAVEPTSGHAVHARAHVHFETGDHAAGLRWLDHTISVAGQRMHTPAHFSWHAALHELALDDAAAVRRRYASQLAPPLVPQMRALVDSGSLLWRCRLDDVWSGELPIKAVLDAAGSELLFRPPTPFAAMHAAIALAAADDVIGLARLHAYAVGHPRSVIREVVAPLVRGFLAYAEERFGDAADAFLPLRPQLVRLGGSAAQREVIEDTLLDALLAARRTTEALAVLERRLDRRPSRKDLRRLNQLQTLASRLVASDSTPVIEPEVIRPLSVGAGAS